MVACHYLNVVDMIAESPVVATAHAAASTVFTIIFCWNKITKSFVLAQLHVLLANSSVKFLVACHCPNVTAVIAASPVVATAHAAASADLQLYFVEIKL